CRRIANVGWFATGEGQRHTRLAELGEGGASLVTVLWLARANDNGDAGGAKIVDIVQLLRLDEDAAELELGDEPQCGPHLGPRVRFEAGSRLPRSNRGEA